MTEEPERTGIDSAPDPADSARPTEAARCPRCAASLDLGAAAIECAGCGRVYPRLGAIPVLLAEPQRYLATCRRQLTRLEDQVDQTVLNIRAQLRAADVLPATRARCLAMIDAVEGQLADVRAVIEPRLPETSGTLSAPVSEAVPATLEYLPYLYRDWGWPAEAGGENERALASVEAVLGQQTLGRTLVLGAGACRLAYDLHRKHPEAELVMLDVDPLLFSAAYAVTHGEPVTVREANLEIGEMGQDSRDWVLSAPHGPVDDDRFHFVVADALDPPFAPATFDTVLTPWFIDQGPDDLRDLVSTVHVALRPGGRWLNLGPLRYDWDVPVALRFTREEIFDLVGRAGFELGRWQSESTPYLVSKLNGRGKVEWVLAFAARKLETSTEEPGAEEGPPAWLLFRHRPIPTFEGQSMFWSKSPAVRRVVSAIDGARTLDDIALLVADQAGQPDISIGQVRVAVRQCLAEVHPAARPEPSS